MTLPYNFSPSTTHPVNSTSCAERKHPLPLAVHIRTRFWIPCFFLVNLNNHECLGLPILTNVRFMYVIIYSFNSNFLWAVQLRHKSIIHYGIVSAQELLERWIAEGIKLHFLYLEFFHCSWMFVHDLRKMSDQILKISFPLLKSFFLAGSFSFESLGALPSVYFIYCLSCYSWLSIPNWISIFIDLALDVFYFFYVCVLFVSVYCIFYWLMVLF